MRAVLDPNVIISALLAPRGAPANVLRAWLDGTFDLVASAPLLDELERALGSPKLAQRVEPAEVQEFLELIRRAGQMIDDPVDPPIIRSPDPGDDYLIALAAEAQAVIVSGDRHLLGLADQLPVYSPADFLALLQEGL